VNNFVTLENKLNDMRNTIVVLAIIFAVVSCKRDNKNKLEALDAREVPQVNVSEAILIDTQNSKVTWKGFKPGGEHYGLISISQGTISLENGNLIGGNFKFDMNSITDLDMPADDEYNKKLVTHLKSPDFFEVEKYPTSTFEITKISELGGDLKISGNLTIKGIIKNITIPAAMVENNGKVTINSSVFTIDRTDFNVRYGSNKFFDNLKDKFINDVFELSFELNTVQ
jgi:polyisoprenoid-binding protein YceI